MIPMTIYPVVPLQFVGSDADKLYRLEHVRSESIRAAAKELAVVLGHTREQFYSATMPQALASLLESYERPCSICAALMYLAQYGTVTLTLKEDEIISISQTDVAKG